VISGYLSHSHSWVYEEIYYPISSAGAESLISVSGYNYLRARLVSWDF